MQRTNIYLTEEQVERLDAEAERAGTTRSMVIREAIDDRLASRKPIDPEVAAAFRELGERWDELVGDMFDDDPDLRIER